MAVNRFFFIFDSYLMKDSTEENDILPTAVLYFYPTDEKVKKEKLVECGEMIAVMNFFLRDLFRSVPQTITFHKSFVVHQYFGRHSAFLSLPYNQYSIEDASNQLKQILDMFHMLYGTWNSIYSKYTNANLNDFLNTALTPILDCIVKKTRSIKDLFSAIDYATLGDGNQRLILQSKHFINHLKGKYEFRDGFIGYNNKILYSSWDTDMTYYLQLIFQSKSFIENSKRTLWKTEYKLNEGVSLYHIYIRHSSNSELSKTRQNTVTTINTNSLENQTQLLINTTNNNRLDGNESLFVNSAPIKILRSLSTKRSNRFDRKISIHAFSSSEETGCETDTVDELSSSSVTTDTASLSSESINEHNESFDSQTNNDKFQESLTDEQKMENLRAHSPSTDNDLEDTLKSNQRIRFFEVGSIVDESEDENENENENETFVGTQRDRTRTITIHDDLKLSEYYKNQYYDMRTSWLNIPEKNNEENRDELILYIQKNSKMFFAGVFEPRLLDDVYLKDLQHFLLYEFSLMEIDIQALCKIKELTKFDSDVKFQFNDNTCHAKFEQTSDNNQIFYKIPTDESSYLALMARSELIQNRDKKIIALSRGDCSLSANRRLPDRTTYSIHYFQDMS